MKLYIPETQKPSSNKLKIEITANGTLTGLDSVLVDVVYPKLDSSVSINGKSLFVKAVDGDLPVQDAQVRLSYSSGRIQSAKTDARGVAEIPAIEAGDILISVSKIGYPSDINISLSETEEKSYWFILPMAVTIAVLAHLVYTRGIQLKSRLKISSRKNK